MQSTIQNYATTHKDKKHTPDPVYALKLNQSLPNSPLGVYFKLLAKTTTLLYVIYPKKPLHTVLTNQNIPAILYNTKLTQR